MAFIDFPGAVGGRSLSFVDISHVSVDFAHSCTFGALGAFRGRARRAPSGQRRALSPHSGVYRLCKQFSMAEQLLVRQRRGTAPAGISAATSGTMVLVGRRLQPQHLWRPGDPAPSSPRRRRCPSPGAKPRLSRAPCRLGLAQRRSAAVPRPAFAGIRSPNFHAGAATVTPGFAGGGFHWRRQFSSVSRRRSSPHRRASLAGLCWRRLPGAWRRHSGSPHRRAGLARGFMRGVGASTPGGFQGWRGHRNPHRRAGLARFCWRRDFQCWRRGGGSAYRRAGLAGFCRRRVSWRWRGWSFPGRRRGVRKGGIGHR